MDASSMGIIQSFSFIFSFFFEFPFRQVTLNTYALVQTLSFTRTASAIESTAKPDTASKERKPIQQAQSNHKDKESVRALAQELSILGELARPTASKCITYGMPFSQLPQREHEKCYISLPRTNKQPDMLNMCNKELR